MSDNLSRLRDLANKLAMQVPLAGMINGDAATCRYAAEELELRRRQVERLSEAGDQLAHESMHTVYHDRWWQARGGQCSVCQPETLMPPVAKPADPPAPGHAHPSEHTGSDSGGTPGESVG